MMNGSGTLIRIDLWRFFSHVRCPCGAESRRGAKPMSVLVLRDLQPGLRAGGLFSGAGRRQEGGTLSAGYFSPHFALDDNDLWIPPPLQNVFTPF